MRFAVFVIMLATAAPPAAAQGEQGREPRTVSVRGHAERSVTPDLAEVTLGVEADDPDPARASDAVASRSAAILSALTASGVRPRDQRTTALTLGVVDVPLRAPDHARRIYRASDVLVVDVSPPSHAGAVVAAALAAGANRVDGVDFVVSPDPSAGDGMRAEAVRDARRKAEGMALAAGATLGEVTSIRSVEGYGGPVRAFRAMAADAVPAVQPGTSVVSQDVDTVWTLR